MPFGCCALLVRARASQAASTSNDGRGVSQAGFLSLEVVAAADHAPLPAASSSGTRAIRGKKSVPSCVSDSACLRWVLSDISTHVTFDLARNQLARSIDVMLEVNPALAAPLSLRKPERTFLVLLTPALTQPGRAGDAISKTQALRLAHASLQRPEQLLAPPAPTPPRRLRLGRSRRTTGVGELEDCHSVAPSACSWLTATPRTG